MARKYKPKRPEEFTTPDNAALFLEAQARLIRRQDDTHPHLIRVGLEFRRWYADEGASIGAVPTEETSDG